MKPTHRLELYRARDGHRWRIRARNNRIVAEGGEAYVQRAGLVRSVRRLFRALMFETLDIAAILPVRKPAKAKGTKA